MNATSHEGENQVRLTDLDTGECFRLVKSQMEKDGSKTLVVTSSALSVKIKALSVEITGSPRYGKTKLFVLLLDKGMTMLGDVHVTQYEKAVFVALVRAMRYGNTVQATLYGLSEATGIKKSNISRALKALKERGAIKEIQGDVLVENVPTYEVNPEMMFRGTFSDALRRKEIERHKEIKLAVVRSRQAA